MEMIRAKLILYDYNAPSTKGYPIKIRVTEGQTKVRKYINLEKYSYHETWDKDLNEPTSSHPNYNTLIKTVLEWRLKLEEKVPKINRKKLSVDQAINYLEKPFINENSFSEYARQTIKHLRSISEKPNEGPGKTASKKESALNSFELYANSNNILFSQIDQHFY